MSRSKVFLFQGHTLKSVCVPWKFCITHDCSFVVSVKKIVSFPRRNTFIRLSLETPINERVKLVTIYRRLLVYRAASDAALVWRPLLIIYFLIPLKAVKSFLLPFSPRPSSGSKCDALCRLIQSGAKPQARPTGFSARPGPAQEQKLARAGLSRPGPARAKFWLGGWAGKSWLG